VPACIKQRQQEQHRCMDGRGARRTSSRFNREYRYLQSGMMQGMKGRTVRLSNFGWDQPGSQVHM
jgi:hypothetical protein